MVHYVAVNYVAMERTVRPTIVTDDSQNSIEWKWQNDAI